LEALVKISDKGLVLIKKYEGLRLKAYKCPAGIWTVGYGSTGPHVKSGMEITEAQANALLMLDVSRFETGVNALASCKTQGQFDALVSFAFNLGLGNLASSTLLKKHKAGDYPAAANQFPRWNKSEGVVLPGLIKRRAEEAALYAS
jgi:lysozyme